MHSFFFGESGRKLYGAYSPPVGGRPMRSPVLLCYPFGQEHIRAHMAFRQLAKLLNRGGCGVLRFDYFGTGDSAGDLPEASLPTWIENTRTAMEELRALAGSKSFSVVGLRLGALAAALAVEGRRDLGSLVLWDPVIEGSAFIREMESQTIGKVDSLWWVNGFPISSVFRSSLEGAELSESRLPESARILHVRSARLNAERPGTRGWSAGGSGIEEIVTQDSGDWNYLDEEGGILLPHETVRSIATWLTGSGNKP